MSEKLEVKKGWFKFGIHDLYSGVSYYGPFTSQVAAEKFDISSVCNWDEVEVHELPYVIWGGKVYAMSPGYTACDGSEELSKGNVI